MKERIFRYNGKSIKLRLSNEIYANLVRRLTVTEQFKKKGCHNIKCLPCYKVDENCRVCVFKDFRMDYGCLSLIRHILKVSHCHIGLHEDYVGVRDGGLGDLKECISEMNKLKKCLEGFKEAS